MARSRYPWSSSIHTAAERQYARTVWSALDDLFDRYTRTGSAVAAATAGWRQRIYERLMSEGTTEYAWWRLDSLRRDLRSAASAWERTVMSLGDEALEGSWASGEGALVRGMAAAGLEPRYPHLDLPQLHLARQHQASLIVRISADTQVKIDSLIEQMVLGEVQPQGIAVPIGRLLDTSARADLGSAAFQAERVIRTEGMRVFNYANFFRGSQLAQEVPGLQKQWVHGGGGLDPRPSHRDELHGKTIAWQDDFSVPTRQGIVKAYGPHDPNLPPDAVIHCTCTLLAVLPEWSEYNKKAGAPSRMAATRAKMQAEWVQRHRSP